MLRTPVPRIISQVLEEPPLTPEVPEEPSRGGRKVATAPQVS
ncbi:hypothetical protein ACFOLD_01640 [Kocuria carniphila]